MTITTARNQNEKEEKKLLQSILFVNRSRRSIQDDFCTLWEVNCLGNPGVSGEQIKTTKKHQQEEEEEELIENKKQSWCGENFERESKHLFFLNSFKAT